MFTNILRSVVGTGANLWARLLLALVFAFTSSVVAQANTPNDGETLRVAPGDQKVLTYMNRISRVATSDPDVAAVSVSEATEILLTAKKEGTSVLTVWLRGRSEPLRSTVVVAATAGHTLPFGTQVQTDVRVLEVSRSKLNSFGFEYQSLGGAARVGIRSATSGSGFAFTRESANALTAINALESGGFAYTLAEPSLAALSGQTATFLSGGEFPVPISGDNGEVEIEYKEFGVSLSLTPTVVDENLIILKVAPEVSDLDFTSGVSSGGVSVPGLRVRRTETMVSMAPVESFIISGLVSRSTFNNSDRLPGLGNIPILGALFRSDRISNEERELIMVVTPRLVSAVRELPESAKNFGKKYEYSSTEWGDMVINPREGTEPLEHGLSW